MKWAHQLSATEYYSRPNFYERLCKVLGKRKYLKKRDYAGMPKKVATKLEAIHVAEEEWKAMLAKAYDDIEAYLIRRFPKEKIVIECSSINLSHPKAHRLLKILASRPKFKGKV